MSAGPAPGQGVAVVAPETARSSIARNAVVLSVANVIARACVLGLAIAMGRGLGVREYGRYGFAVALATIVVPISDIGISSYVWREVASLGRSGDATARALSRLKLWLSLATVLIAGGIALVTSAPPSAALLIVVLAAAVADGASAFVFGYLQGRERMGFEAWWTVATGLTRSLGGIVIVIVTGQLMPVVLWLLAVSSVQVIAATRRFRAEVSVGDSGSPAPVAWGSLVAMGVLAASVLVYIRADSVLLGISLGRRAVGLYTAAYSLMGAVQIIPLQISQAVVPALSRTYASGRTEFLAIWDAGHRIVLVVALPLALMTALMSVEALRIPYGRLYSPASAALAVLVWAGPLGVVNALGAGALFAARRERWPALVSILAMVLNVGLNLWAIPSFGLVGAAGVTIGTEAAVLMLQFAFLVRTCSVRLPRLPWRALAASLAAMVGATELARGLGLIPQIVAGVLSYAAVAAVTGAADVPRFIRRSAA